jgi:hypothetical protein
VLSDLACRTGTRRASGGAVLRWIGAGTQRSGKTEVERVRRRAGSEWFSYGRPTDGGTCMLSDVDLLLWTLVEHVGGLSYLIAHFRQMLVP